MNNQLNVILTGTASDSHMWNLIFMELFLQENGCNVRNLGPCVPFEELSSSIQESKPDLIVISSISGHLFQDAMKIMASFADQAVHLPPVVVGGKIGISEKSKLFQKRKLIKLGYDDVFINDDSLERFKKYLSHLRAFKIKSPLKRAL